MGWHRVVKHAHKHFKRNVTSGGKQTSSPMAREPVAGPEMGAAAGAAQNMQTS